MRLDLALTTLRTSSGVAAISISVDTDMFHGKTDAKLLYCEVKGKRKVEKERK